MARVKIDIKLDIYFKNESFISLIIPVKLVWLNPSVDFDLLNDVLQVIDIETINAIYLNDKLIYDNSNGEYCGENFNKEE